MARSRGDRPHGRFGKSGHTQHLPRVPSDGATDAFGDPAADAPTGRLPDGGQLSDRDQPTRARRPVRAPYAPPQRRIGSRPHRPDHDSPPPPPPYREPVDAFGNPTYHHTPAAARGSAAGTQQGQVAGGVAGKGAKIIGRSARGVTRKVIGASKANGADESGLTALIWNQVLSYGADAMITVALAGTVFFGASAHAQRGNVLLYLLVTVAPFAVVAPIIGPALDRLQHGRRWTMAGTGIGRAVLSLIMAAHPTDLLVLYPCALGSLVLSKAYAVVRAAAAPRLVPKDMTLTEANARVTIFGLGSTLVLGGLVGVIIKVTGSYSAGLVVTAVGFSACAFFCIRLPKQVDSAVAAPRHPQEPDRPRRQDRVASLSRIHAWARRGFDPHLIVALQAESVLRLLSGLLTFYLAFYVESTQHGFNAVVDLGLVIGAAGAGNFLGTAIGTRLTGAKPETLIVISVCVAALVCLIVAGTYGIVVAAVGMLIASVANSLSKVGLDSLIQRDVVETLRSSAFGRSETFLQLAYVIGAVVGVVLPSRTTGNGAVAFLVAGIVVGAVALLVVLRTRATRRANHPYGPNTVETLAHRPVE